MLRWSLLSATRSTCPLTTRYDGCVYCGTMRQTTSSTHKCQNETGNIKTQKRETERNTETGRGHETSTRQHGDRNMRKPHKHHPCHNILQTLGTIYLLSAQVTASGMNICLSICMQKRGTRASPTEHTETHRTRPLTSVGSAHSRGAVRRVCGAGPVLLGFT